LDQGTHLIGSSAYDLNLLPPTGTATHQDRNTFEFFSFSVKRFPCIANQTIDQPELGESHAVRILVVRRGSAMEQAIVVDPECSAGFPHPVAPSGAAAKPKREECSHGCICYFTVPPS
jgi:hypothetical protein